jgi:hypothetical protein
MTTTRRVLLAAQRRLVAVGAPPTSGSNHVRHRQGWMFEFSLTPGF